MRHLINNLPNKSFAKPTNWEHIEGIQLADPGFNISKPIDILFGAEIYSKIILGGIMKGEESQPIAQQSQIGWLLCGEVKPVYQCNVVLNNLEDMNRFWAIEDVTEDSQMSTEDIKCLKQYQTETKRQKDGRYIVRLPLHEDIDQKLGESRTKAAAQLYQLEKKFEKSENIAQNYKLFMSEYIELKHMQPCEQNSKPEYYLPHHCVQRVDSTTTALRVVYNGSAKSTSNHSLNDLMYRGPNFQADLMSIILKWREYQIVLLADIEKMFRQILVHEDDRKYQKILWRDSPTQPMQEYTLSTVTYGTKAAPFLAMMTLKQLANDERNTYPEAAAILESSFYMDDLLCSIDDLETALRIKTDLTNLLKSGGFNLRKWSSNNFDLLNPDTSNNQSNAYDFRHQESTKALGLRWNPGDDNFTFQLPFDMKSTKTITKRHLLSEISKVFDPLGWLSPVTTKLKLIFQQVWREELKWDDEVPETINKQWLTIKSELTQLNELRIPRWLQITKKAEIELHGYADASEKAYACVVYAKVKKNPNKIIIVAAKSRLVPAKKSITLPRLELCAALLLATLLKKIRECLDSNHNITIYGYSDSTTTLAWLGGRHDRWKPFVSNRVKKITDIVPSNCWRYVKSSENPADCASRGITPSQLKEHQLWWNGPQWLPTYQPQENIQDTYETKEEVKKLQTNITTKQHESDVISDVLTRNSSLTRATNVIAWMLRALSRNKTRLNYLTLPEIKEARYKIIKYIQLTSFGNDISALQKNKEVDSKSKLLPLNPYLDEKGLLRVGGRIHNANIDDNQKHPLIIPHQGHFTELLIDKAHEMKFHGGARMTSAHLRKHYWIIGGNRAVKKRIYNCVKCRRHNPIRQTQLMGNLPASRCNPTRPFYHTSTDYTGYIDIKTNKGRGVKTTKGYVAVFVCMVTKAVHLEMVSDLTSSAFLSALRRLAARRGTPAHMYSDNGTNFVGANKILQHEFINLKETLDTEFFTTITDMEIEWHFNAPSWPSAGGLWEAAVKSLKFHLRRVIGEQKLTYEEMSTLLAQLEACLNSRPLSTLTEDPEDLDYLTPSHFLSSGPNLTIYETEKDERTRWQLVQRIFRDIWRRWQAEYLVQLSTRGKWRQAKNNIKINDIVVVHDTNLPAGRWVLGRVVELHPGQDGYVRVVTVKTKNGLVKRPIIKLSKLLVTRENEELTQTDAKQTETNKEPEKEPETKIKTCNEEQEPKLPSQPRRSKRIKRTCNLTWLMLSILSVFSPARCNYSLTNLNRNQSIYFDKVTDMHLARNEWKLIVYYDFNPYWDGIRTYKTYINDLDTLCPNTTKERNQCDVIMIQLRHGLSELVHYNNVLLRQQLPESRKRRGLINGIGNIANALFGILDQDFATKYEQDIAKIKENEKHLNLLWKNQTSVVEAENNILKRVEQSIQKQHTLYMRHLDSINKAVKTLANEVANVKRSTYFISMSIIANNILVNLKEIQEVFLDIITEITYGKFNIHLLNPEQLTKELNIISGHMSKDLSLPINNIQTDLQNIYHLLKVKARMTGKYLILEIKIPLVTRDSYEIYNMIPIPLKSEDTTMKVIPVAKYVAINLQKDVFFPLSEEEFRACTIHSTESILCLLHQPLVHLRTDNQFCIQKNKTNMCEIKQIECTDVWLPLNKINTYLYFICGHTTIRIICEHQVTAVRVTKAGIIALADNCIIKGETFTIYSQTQQTNQLFLQPDVLKVDIPPINNIFNLTLPMIEVKTDNEAKYTSYSRQLDDIDRRIQEMKDSEFTGELTDSLTTHDIHQYVVVYLLLGAILFGVATYLWRRWRRHSITLEDRRQDIQLAERPAPPARRPILMDIPGSSRGDSGSSMTQTNARIDKATSPVRVNLFGASDNN